MDEWEYGDVIKSKEELEKYIAKNGLSLTAVPSMIKENDYQAGALQDARAVVRWAFEAKKGEISEPFSVGDQFIVAVLDKINDKGVQDATTARPGCEAIIRNNKKADIIKKKIGNNPTLESASSAYGKQIQGAGADSTITFNSQIINGVGMEASVIGAAFNKEYQSKVSPLIDGTTGVFIVKVNSIQNKPAEAPEAVSVRATSKIGNIRSQTNGWYEGLRKQANIVDERSKHY
jgi:peptidyl-prolyl cis-trans isomerase D